MNIKKRKLSSDAILLGGGRTTKDNFQTPPNRPVKRGRDEEPIQNGKKSSSSNSAARVLINIELHGTPEQQHKITCQHGKNLTICVDCGGKYICEHKIRRRRCPECKNAGCGGEDLCSDHFRRKDQCKDCKGRAICNHGVIKYSCIACKGSAICTHGRRKYRCVQCNGKSICEHEKRRSQCKLCKGTSICDHNRVKFQCKDCRTTRELFTQLEE